MLVYDMWRLRTRLCSPVYLMKLFWLYCWYVQIHAVTMSMRENTGKFTFVLSHNVHIPSFWPGCHIWRRRWSYRWERCQASDSSLRQSARVSAAANVKTLDGFWCWTTLFHRLSAWHHWKVLRKPQDNSQQVCGARNVFYKVSGYLQLCLLWPHQVF